MVTVWARIFDSPAAYLIQAVAVLCGLLIYGRNLIEKDAYFDKSLEEFQEKNSNARTFWCARQNRDDNHKSKELSTLLNRTISLENIFIINCDV